MPPQAQNYISGCENFLLRVVLSKTDTPTPSSQYLSIMQLKLLMTPSPLLQMMYQVSTDPEESLWTLRKAPLLCQRFINLGSVREMY